MRILLFIHAVLMLLACTSYTIVTFFFDGAWKVSFWNYWKSDGFGKQYSSPFPELDIYTYIAGFAIGVVAFGLAIRNGKLIVGIPGVLLSLVGVCCFVNELIQISNDRYHAWVWVCPTLMIILAIIASLPKSFSQRNGGELDRKPSSLA